MKKTILVLAMLFSLILQAQDAKLVPQITVSGEGKIKVSPDQVNINFGIDNIGKDALEVKNLNDQTVDKVLKFIKKFGIPAADVLTTKVSLNRNYDYDKKKYSFQATQSITIILKDLAKYDSLIMGLMDNGINTISNVVFESSKIEEFKSEVRKLAIKEAKHKAEDFVLVVGQKVGKAIIISDNSAQSFPPQPMYKMMALSDNNASKDRETIAAGDIEVTANVSVSFLLE